MAFATIEDAIAIALVAIVAAVIVVDCILLIVHLLTSEAVRSGARPPVFAEKWSLTHPWWAGQQVAGVTIMLTGCLAGSLGVRHVPGHPAEPPAAFILFFLLLQNALLAGAASYYIVLRYGERLVNVGFRRRPSLRDVKLGIGFGTGMLLVGLLTESGTRALARAVLPAGALRVLTQLTNSVDPSDFVAELSRAPMLMLAVLVAFACVVPLGEEFFFRAFLHNCARRRLGLVLGTLVSAGVFALVHGGPLSVPPIFCLGVMLALAYERTQSLWVPIIMHGVNNGVLVIVTAMAGGAAR